MRFVQDGRVEGRPSSRESTEITTNWRTTIDRRHWNPPKKRYLTSKDTGEAIMRWQEGHNYDKNQILKLPGRWRANWRTITPLMFSHCNEGSEPRIRVRILGGLATGLGIPRESDFEGLLDLIIELTQDGGKQRLPHGGHIKSCAQQDPEESSSDHRGGWSKPIC